MELSKEQYRELVSNLTDGILIVDTSGDIIYESPPVQRITGYTPEERVGGHVFEHVHPDDQQMVRETFSEITESEDDRIVTTELRYCHKDGSWIWLKVRGRNETTSSIGGYVVSVSDITETKEREERLEQTTARLEALFENSPDMIDIHTTEGTIIDVNQQFCEAFNQPKEELVGQKVWEIDQEIEPDELREIWDGMDVGERAELETEFQTKDGTRFPVEIHLTRLPVDNGNQFMVISRDLTRRKQRIQEIQTLKERLELAVDGANLGVWDWDMTTDEVEFNDQWAEMLGYALEDLEPHLSTWESRVHPDDIENVKAALEAHIQQETEYYDTEHRMRTADGEWKWIRDLGKIVERDGDGEPVRAVGIHLDIDETKQYQRELERKTERLDEFASIVSHDLRNPLSVAAGNLELARDDCESPHLESIERAHDRMRALIEELLTLAREGEAVTETETVNLATVVRECWEIVETAEASLTIETETDRTVVADKPRLKQLLENLIRNAVEHGGSTVDVTVGGLDNGFYIEDNGPGIPEDDAAAVFEAEYSTNDEGTGFGLSIVQRIAEAHGWTIHVTNSGGARFEITGVAGTID
jgi:PAS domain S-box-containing protein